MDVVVKITDGQLGFIGSLIGRSQDELVIEIENLKKDINELQLLLKSKEALFDDNNNTLLQLGIKKENGLQRKAALTSLANTVGAYIELTSTADHVKEINLGQYNTNVSDWEKVKYVLNKQNKALTGRQIIEEIYNFEPELKNIPEEMRKKHETNVFALLSNYSKQDKIKRFRVDGKDYRYGFSKWFDEVGEIKKEYLI